MPVSKRLLTFFLLAMKSRHEHNRVALFRFPAKISVGPVPGATSLKMPKRRMEDSDDDFPIFAERKNDSFRRHWQGYAQNNKARYIET
jgi:hypothetical protein